MVNGLFAGQHNTKLHGTIIGVIYTIVGSAFAEGIFDRKLFSQERSPMYPQKWGAKSNLSYKNKEQK